MSEAKPSITGLGYSVPARIRKNDDPIFDWIKKNNPQGENLFEGYDERRVLSDGEDLMTIMVPAAHQALDNAGILAKDVDLLLGTASISTFKNPNMLSKLHQKLGLSKHVWVVPIDSDFSNYNASIFFADALLRERRVNNVLICIGGNWSQNVDYHTPQAISAADGAGALVMSLSDNPSQWTVVDHHSITDTHYYGSMFTNGDIVEVSPPQSGFTRLLTPSYFHITNQGFQGFKDFGVSIPPLVASELIERNQLTGADITLISHQASSFLMDAWTNVIKPAQYINTIKTFANMAISNIAVNMGWADVNEPIENDHLVLLSIGTDMHSNALLLSRNR